MVKKCYANEINNLKLSIYQNSTKNSFMFFTKSLA